MKTIAAQKSESESERRARSRCNQSGALLNVRGRGSEEAELPLSVTKATVATSQLVRWDRLSFLSKHLIGRIANVKLALVASRFILKEDNRFFPKASAVPLLSFSWPLLPFLLLLSAAGCTFDEDTESSFCDYRQGQDDDFDWQLIRTYNWPHPTPDLLRGMSHGRPLVNL